MLSAFENKVADFIKSSTLFGSADKILLAVSGGADSIALMYVMEALKSEKVFGAELMCAHINHQLRGAQAQLDENFVVCEAAKLKLAAMTRRLDVRGFARRNKLSIETAARRLRIDSLLDIAKANNCKWIATGHQKNDNAETIIGRLLRGTGFRGLGGIWPERCLGRGIHFARPLLCVSREEIIQYLQKRNLRWRVDRTNYEFKYRRNFIRHLLLPALQKDCRGCMVEQLAELADSARRFYHLLSDRADAACAESAERSGDTIVLDLKKFSAQHPAVKVELVRRSLAAIGSGERDLTHGHYENILQLPEQNIEGSRIVLPGGFEVRREYGNLIFSRAEEPIQAEEKTVKSAEVPVPGETRFANHLIEAAILGAGQADFGRFKGQKSKFVEWFDFDKVAAPLTVRFREAGDRFWPLGLAAEKKLGKFMTAARLPQAERKKVLIVSDGDKIIWVWPIRIAEQVKVNQKTRTILQLRITNVGDTKQE